MFQGKLSIKSLYVLLFCHISDILLNGFKGYITIIFISFSYQNIDMITGLQRGNKK